MSSMVAGILQNKGATGSTPNQKSNLPKLDYVSPTLRKQILEGKDINLALLLYPKNEVP